MIDGTMTVRDLLTSVSRHYEIEAAQCEADVFSFLQQLAEQELIEKVAVKPN